MKLEVDLPVLKKFLFCLPLREGIIACGYLQFVAVIIIAWHEIEKFAIHARHFDHDLVETVIMFMIAMIISLIEIIYCMFLILGAQMKNVNFLEVCYHYLKVKIPAYALLLIIMFCVQYSYFSWYWYSTYDSWRFNIVFDSPVIGLIDLVIQCYMLLLVRSEIIQLEHPIDFVQLRRRYFQNMTCLQAKSPIYKNFEIQHEPETEKEKNNFVI